ncbi:MAG: ABC transporter permease [Acidimicrobiia bacterium]|nr:ABC transporter permease [Acidimicrobiia bacterium]
MTLRGLASLLVVNLRLYVRDPIGAFFTLAFPVMLVLIFGTIFGNEPQDMFDGRGSMDITMPAYTALILGSVGLLGVAINTSSYREAGILRRFRMTPLRPLVYIAADVIANLTMTLAGMAGVLVVGWLLYRVQFEGRAVNVFLAVILSGTAMFAVGYLIAGLAPNARTAQIIGMVVLYPMLFLSGAGMPLEVMPDSIRTISEYLPLTYVVRLLRGLWFGEPWGSLLLETGVLVGILVICTAVAARLFRWE